MFEHCKKPNSKCFLITYLVLVVFLLLLWRSSNDVLVADQRQIPSDIAPYLLFPPKDLMADNGDNKLALTSNNIIDKWSFVYFSHYQCLPGCDKPLLIMNELRAHFSTKDIQFIIINLEAEQDGLSAKLNQFLDERQMSAMVISTSIDKVEQLAQQFEELFLKTHLVAGRYQIEQQHQLFVVDPKGRVYAKFTMPYTVTEIQKAFVSLRRFYAQTE